MSGGFPDINPNGKPWGGNYYAQRDLILALCPIERAALEAGAGKLDMVIFYLECAAEMRGVSPWELVKLLDPSALARLEASPGRPPGKPLHDPQAIRLEEREACIAVVKARGDLIRGTIQADSTVAAIVEDGEKRDMGR
jgi:hypothetical protein